MCEECPGYPTKCLVCGYDNHLITSEICSSCVKAIKQEQERIIKLLENAQTEATNSINYAFTATVQTKFVWMAEAYNEAIALIKGEK